MFYSKAICKKAYERDIIVTVKLEYTDSKRKKRELLSVYIIMIRLLLKNYINILFENDYWNSAYYRCIFILL